MLESSIESSVRRWCKTRNILFLKMDASIYKGIPDRLCILPNGQMVFLEFKTPTGKVSKHQERYLADLNFRGVRAWVVYSRSEAIELLEMML